MKQFLVSLLFIAASAHAETITYDAPAGTVSPNFAVTQQLTLGGVAIFNPSYTAPLIYALPDGSTANLPNAQNVVTTVDSTHLAAVSRAAGVDSLGRPVSAVADAGVLITCGKGRDGECTKTYTGGTLSVEIQPE